VRIPQEQIKEIVDRLSIVEVVREYVALEQRGDRFWGLCPFHGEKTASFTVSNDREAYYCFGCSRGGGLVQFVMDVEDLGFREAMELLAERAGVTIEAGPTSDGGAPPRKSYVDLCTRLAGALQHLYQTSEEAAEARRYVAERGIDATAAEHFRLGWAPSQPGWLHGFLRKKNYSDDFLLQSGLFVKRDGQMRAIFWRRLMFPISNARGEVLAFGGRSLRDGGPKYVNSAESPFFHKAEHLYGLDLALAEIRASGRAPTAAPTNSALVAGSDRPAVAVVEGYTDVMALFSIGVPAVAPLGTAFGNHHASLLSRHGLATLLVYDGDAAGNEAVLRTLHELARQDVPAAVVQLPPASDPADLVAQGRGGELQEMLRSPIKWFRYIIAAAVVGKDLRTAEGKEHAFREIHPFLQDVDSVIAREALLQELAAQLGVDDQAAREEYARLVVGGRGGGRRGGSVAQNRAERPDEAVGGSRDANVGTVSAELRLMLAIAVNRGLFAGARNLISADDLWDRGARELFVALEDCFRRGEDDTDSLARRLESDELRQLYLRKLATDEFTEHPEEYVSSGIQQIRIGAVARKRQTVLERLRNAERDHADEEVSELLADKIHLDTELERLRRTPLPRTDGGTVGLN
jgi:DNA primase